MVHVALDVNHGKLANCRESCIFGLPFLCLYFWARAVKPNRKKLRNCWANARIEEDLKVRLEEYCDRSDRPVSWVMRKALEEFLEREALIDDKRASILRPDLAGGDGQSSPRVAPKSPETSPPL